MSKPSHYTYLTSHKGTSANKVESRNLNEFVELAKSAVEIVNNSENVPTDLYEKSSEFLNVLFDICIPELKRIKGNRNEG